VPTFEIADGVRSLPREQWNALVGDDSPFLEWDWLAGMETTGVVDGDAGWLAQPLVARDGDRLLAAVPLYVKGNSEGEFVFDHGWAEAAHRAGIRYYPKLLVGTPFTPVTGARFLVAPGLDRRAWIARSAEKLREIAVENALSSVHVNFCRADEMDVLRDAGFLARTGLQYHWVSRGWKRFDEYLDSFRHKRRKEVRRELRAIEEAGVSIETRVGAEIPDAWFEPMWRFYRSTIDGNPWGRLYLNRDFFGHLRDHFRERLCFVMALRDGAPIAGAFDVQKGDALYGRYWGATEFVKHLHFAVCYYAGIEHCVRNGLTRFEPGAGGHYKQTRGFDAQPTWSAHFVADPRLARAVERYLAHERAETDHAIAHLREHSALKPTVCAVEEA
jgi:predicted N-acyltransferase